MSPASNPASESGTTPDASSLFLGTETGAETYQAAIDRTVDALREAVTDAEAPYSGADPDDLAAAFEDPVLPESGIGLDAAIDEVADRVLPHCVDTTHPRCAAHLHCPPMVPGLAAEAMLAATNQSLDSFDQAPVASVLEERVVETLCDLFDLPAESDGVFTSGGTQSNLQALLLARDRYCERHLGCDVQEDGVPPATDSLRILCSADAHFTAEQAAHVLGLGEGAVVTVPTDSERRLAVDALEETLARLEADGARPFALVGTAGTTDFGSVDPLGALADHAATHDLWFHVDAAYGGALALHDEYDHLLEGIERADSLAVDFHKLFYQPISCGAFLLSDGGDFGWMARNAAYLNPAAHEERGVPNLVGKSLQTTRRFDALKPYVTFRALGREGLASLLESTLALAEETATRLEAAPDFDLLAEPRLNAVVFRYRPEGFDGTGGEDESALGRLNAAIRESLLAEGRAVVARTEVDGVTSLKFTLLNPQATSEDVDELLEAIRERGAELAAERGVVA